MTKAIIFKINRKDNIHEIKDMCKGYALQDYCILFEYNLLIIIREYLT